MMTEWTQSNRTHPVDMSSANLVGPCVNFSYFMYKCGQLVLLPFGLSFLFCN